MTICIYNTAFRSSCSTIWRPDCPPVRRVACPRAGSLVLLPLSYRPSRMPVTAQSCAQSPYVPYELQVFQLKTAQANWPTCWRCRLNCMFNCWSNHRYFAKYCTRSVISRKYIFLSRTGKKDGKACVMNLSWGDIKILMS